MKNIKLAMITACFAVLLTISVSGDVFRMGANFAIETLDRDYGSIVTQFQNQDNIYAGFSWEVLIGHFGMGMTAFTRFDHDDSLVEGIDKQWFIRYIGTYDFRWYLFRDGFLEPYAELGVGSAGSIDVTQYEDARVYIADLNRMAQLSISSQAGVGLTLNIENIYFGGKILYRLSNDAPPATSFDVFPLKNFQVTLYSGVSF